MIIILYMSKLIRFLYSNFLVFYLIKLQEQRNVVVKVLIQFNKILSVVDLWLYFHPLWYIQRKYNELIKTWVENIFQICSFFHRDYSLCLYIYIYIYICSISYPIERRNKIMVGNTTKFQIVRVSWK